MDDYTLGKKDGYNYIQLNPAIPLYQYPHDKGANFKNTAEYCEGFEAGIDEGAIALYQSVNPDYLAQDYFWDKDIHNCRVMANSLASSLKQNKGKLPESFLNLTVEQRLDNLAESDSKFGQRIATDPVLRATFIAAYNEAMS